MHTEDVVFLSEGTSLAGTLTLPSDIVACPCVIMVHGSGPQDRDGNISGFNVQVFKFLAEHFAENGIAALRYDKRGCAQSDGSFKESGLSEMVSDACSAIDYARQRVEIDKKCMYVLGHSEGAVLSPEIGLKRPDIAGIIMLCASLRSFEEDSIKNAEVLNRDLEKMVGIKGWLARLLFYTKDPQKTMVDLRRKVEKTKAKQIWVSFSRVSTKFYRETFNYDVKSYLNRNKLPILAIGGSKDFQCHPDDTRQIPLTTASEVTVRIIENMDHMLRNQEGEPTLLSYRNAGKTPIVQEVKEQVSNWVKLKSEQAIAPEK
ncbi:alpha/beta hydrolase family protein [Vreelandella zhaodongensis]|uniref:alpha/beta hydrolase family protein n=1 Tax=Vreelandella zhaodongensis TaxID=1176240 RepID=UPI001C54DFED|nr:alpha/beta hydrolase [Halomonas zhaodongensis]